LVQQQQQQIPSILYVAIGDETRPNMSPLPPERALLA